MFELRVSPGATEIAEVGKSSRKYSCVVLPISKRRSSCTEFRVLASMIIISRRKELESVGELSKGCTQIVLKCLYLARTGGPDILWSVNELARSVTKWAPACDRRFPRLTSYIHH